MKQDKFSFARSNRIKPARRTIGMPSQRERINPKTGKATKKPSARLMARRAKDTIPGYYPNPAPSRRGFGNTQMKHVINSTFKTLKMVQGKADAITWQAHLSYAQGLIAAAYICEAIDGGEQDAYNDMLVLAQSGKL